MLKRAVTVVLPVFFLWLPCRTLAWTAPIEKNHHHQGTTSLRFQVGSHSRHCACRVTTTTTTKSRLALARQICTFEADDFGDTWPYDASSSDLRRMDESDDERFYDQPRFVTHIDDAAIASLTEYYRDEFQRILQQEKKKARGDDGSSGSGDAIDVLDLCSSWISHLPTDVPLGRVAGVGINEAELAANQQLTEYHVQNLNKKPQLEQFTDNSFDVICNVVSVDYLTKPLEIFREMYRILRPGGVAIVSFSNRMFATKAVNVWLQADDIGRLSIVGSYFYHSAPWSLMEAWDLKPEPQKAPERPSVKVCRASPPF